MPLKSSGILVIYRNDDLKTENWTKKILSLSHSKIDHCWISTRWRICNRSGRIKIAWLQKNLDGSHKISSFYKCSIINWCFTTLAISFRVRFSKRSTKKENKPETQRNLFKPVSSRALFRIILAENYSYLRFWGVFERKKLIWIRKISLNSWKINFLESFLERVWRMCGVRSHHQGKYVPSSSLICQSKLSNNKSRSSNVY